MAGSAKTKLNTALKLNPLVHERARLAILSALGAHGKLSFNELKSVTGATDGNLSTHSNKLEDAGYISTTKGFLGRRKRTNYSITQQGKQALLDYLNQLEQLMDDVRGEI